jgi:hypothetical protein
LELPIPPTPEVVGCKEPEITHELWARKARNAVPDKLGEVHIPDRRAVDVNFEIIGETFDLLGNAPLSSVPFVQER